MGAKQSAHKLTVVNDEAEGNVIQVSNAIVQRLTEGLKQTSNQSANADVRVQHSRKPAVSGESEIPSANSPQGNVPASGYSSFHYPEYTITALQMQKQKEVEIDELDAYWGKRLLNLEMKHEKINSILQNEYNKAVVDYKSEKKGCNEIMVPCMENTKKIAKCYQDHPHQALECAPFVKEFASCVDECRTKIIASRC